jgi:hypothetical protein
MFLVMYAAIFKRLQGAERAEIAREVEDINRNISMELQVFRHCKLGAVLWFYFAA